MFQFFQNQTIFVEIIKCENLKTHTGLNKQEWTRPQRDNNNEMFVNYLISYSQEVFTFYRWFPFKNGIFKRIPINFKQKRVDWEHSVSPAGNWSFSAEFCLHINDFIIDSDLLFALAFGKEYFPVDSERSVTNKQSRSSSLCQIIFGFCTC